MKKQLRLLAILGAVVVVLGAALSVVLLTKPEDSGDSSAEESSDTSITLLEIKKQKETSGEESAVSRIKEAVIKTGSETYTVCRDKDGQLYVKGYEKLPVQTSLFDSLETELTKIVATQEIKFSGNDADYGLDKPTATAEVTYDDGTKATLTVGAAAPQDAGYYFRISGKDGVYLVDSGLADALGYSAVSYIGTTLYAAPAVKSDDENGSAVLRDVTMKGPGLEREYSYRMAVADDGSEFTYCTYVLTYPYKRSTNTNTLGESIAGATSLLADTAVVPFPKTADLKKYGLDTPAINAEIHTAVQTSTTSEPSEVSGESKTITSFYNVQEHTIKISAVKNGTFYVLVDDIDCIYQVSASSLPWATLSYEDCVTSLMFLKDITTVNKMSFTFNGKTHQFALTHYPDEDDNEKNMAVTMDGKTINTSYFRSFYQVLMGVDRAGAAPEAPKGTPEISFTYTDKDTNRSTLIELFPYSASVYIGRFDKGDTFKVRASTVDELLRQYQNLIDGKEVLLG